MTNYVGYTVNVAMFYQINSAHIWRGIVLNEGVTEKSLICHRILIFIFQQIIFKILKDYFCGVGIVYVLFKDYSTLYEYII